MRIQRFSILMIFFSETYPENVQNNFMKNPANCVREFNAFSFWVYFLEIFFQNISWTISQQIWLLCKIIQRFSTLMIFSGKYIPSIQQSKNQELLRIVVETLFISSLLLFRRRKKCNVEKNCFWWLFRNPSQPSRRLSNDLYIESATTDAISDLFQNWTFPFFISGWIETSKSDQYSCPFNFGPNVVRGHIYHSTDSWGKKSVC